MKIVKFVLKLWKKNNIEKTQSLYISYVQFPIFLLQFSVKLAFLIVVFVKQFWNML